MARTQQMKLYAAEDTLDRGRTFASLEEIQNWVDALREQSWGTRDFPQ